MAMVRRFFSEGYPFPAMRALVTVSTGFSGDPETTIFLVAPIMTYLLDGGVENDVLHGGTGNDQLIANYSNDQLFGDPGLDTFEIHASSLVTTIRDFKPFTVTGVTWSFSKGISYSFDHEKIDLTAFNFDDYSDLMGRSAEVHGDAYLVLDSDSYSYVIIENVSLSDLSAENFLF